MKRRGRAGENLPSAFEATQRQGDLCDDVCAGGRVPDHQISGFADFEAVIVEAQRAGRPLGDHIETNAQILRPVTLDDVGVEIDDPNQRAIAIGRERVQHIVAGDGAVGAVLDQRIGVGHAADDAVLHMAARR